MVYWQNDSHFSGLEPDQYFFFARAKETADHSAGGTSAPSPFRVKTPSPAAQETVAALGLGTSLLRPYHGTHQYIWYGTEHGETADGSEEPILWRILDTKTNMQTEGLFLISDKLYGTGTNGDLHFSEQPPYSNDYSNSSARRWCQNFAQTHLNPLEQSAILLTTKTDAPYSDAFDGAPFILSNDKVFLPSAEEISRSTYGFGSDASRQGRYHSDSAAYWLRSPSAQDRSKVGYVDATGAVMQNSAMTAYAARPAFNLDSSQVLYTAAVNNAAETDPLGLKQIQSVQSQDFRLVLKDPDRPFRVTSSLLTAQPGESVVLGYEGATLSQTGSEFLSVIVMDAEGTAPMYYGKIAAVQTESGEIRFTLPSDLADGTYTLKVFNEQYNGEKRTGTASPFCDVTLKIETPHVAVPIAQVHLSLTAPVTGQTPQSAGTETEGCFVESTTWTPDDAVFQANTDYAVSLVLRANEGYTFTKDTEVTLNGEAVVPVADGDAYVITYDAFPTTEDPDSGETVPASGWQHNDYGWWYNDQKGNYVTGWQQINGYWYYFAPNGYMQTGWQQVNGYWYYFSPSGDMQTGWQMVNGYWYYFAPSGYMLTGWQVVNGYWYYFSPSGDMQTGWQMVNGYWYYFAPSGYMMTGWQMVNGYWYYFAPSGYMQTGWQMVNGYWYYFAPSGYMLTGWQVINGYWYYFAPSGYMMTGWQWIHGSCYYFYPSGYMAANTWIGGSYVNGSGAWVQ